ncbi:MAG: S9 family peptidase [Acidobacteriota bacterium]
MLHPRPAFPTSLLTTVVPLTSRSSGRDETLSTPPDRRRHSLLTACYLGPAPLATLLVLLATFWVAPWAAPAYAEEGQAPGPALRAESLYQWSYPTDPRISPSGEAVVWVRVDTDPVADRYRSDLWLTDLGTGESRQLTTHPENDHSPRFSPDGRYLLFVSQRVKPAQLFLLDLQGGEARQLTEMPESVSQPVWSPRGNHIAFSSRTPGDALRAEAAMRQEQRQDEERKARQQAAAALGLDPDEDDWAEIEGPVHLKGDRFRSDGNPGFTPEHPTRLWLLDLPASLENESLKNIEPLPPASSALRPVTRSVGVQENTPVFSPDGEILYFSIRHDPDLRAGRPLPDSEIYRIALSAIDAAESAPPERISLRLGIDDQPLIDPQGRYLLWLGSDDADPYPTYVERDLLKLPLLDRYGPVPLPQQRIRNLTTGFPRSVGDGTSRDVASPLGGARNLSIGPDGRYAYFTTADRGSTHLARLDVESAKVQALTQPGADLYAFALGPDGLVVAIRSTPTSPFDLYTTTLPSEPKAGQALDWRRLTDLHGELLAAHRPRTEYQEVRTTTEDGVDLQGWLLLPNAAAQDGETADSGAANSPGEKLPLIVYVHGGPHTMYGTTFFHEFQTLVDAGYAVLITNPRGSSGYGSDFARTIQGDFPGKDADDIIVVLEEVLASGRFDPQRLGIAGGSGGGLLTSWIIAHYPERFTAAVAQRNVTNWHSFAGTSDIGSYVIFRWFRTLPWSEPEDYLRRSPLQWSHKIQTPLLIIHSDEDWRTPLEQSEQLYNALRIQGKSVEMMVFPGESHGLSRSGRPGHRVSRLNAIRDFFDRHLD